MKYKVKVQKHVEEHWEKGKTICDFCKRDVDKARDNSFDYSEIEIEAKIGSVYPEGDFRQGYRIDSCSECFIEKVVPAIEALGVKWHEFDAEDVYPSSTTGTYYVEGT